MFKTAEGGLHITARNGAISPGWYTAWYGYASGQDEKHPDKVVRTASKITEYELPSTAEIYATRQNTKGHKTLQNFTGNPWFFLFFV